MSDFVQFLLSTLSSAAAATVLLGAAAWLFRSWISARLQASVRHEYDHRMAEFNAELRRKGDEQEARLKEEIDRRSDYLRAAASSFGEGQKASMTRRLDAIEKLWASVLAPREAVPPVLKYMDILVPEEYVSAKNHSTYSELLRDLDHMKASRAALELREDIESVRPYLGEYAWAVFATELALIFRAAYLVDLGKKDPAKLNWHVDDGIRQLILSALGNDGLAAFNSTTIGKVGWITSQFEQRILHAIHDLISGKELGDAALQQARIMEERVRSSTLKQNG